MAKIKINREPSPADKQTVEGLFHAMPLIERGKPLMAELTWFLTAFKDAEPHQKILPEYCYHTFEALRRTYFQGFPLHNETVLITDQARLSTAQGIEEAKKVVRLDWKNLGRLFSIAGRCFRFADLEALPSMERAGYGGSTPEQNKRYFEVVMGKEWYQQNQADLAGDSFADATTNMLQERFAAAMPAVVNGELKFHQLAYEWGPAAMAEFNLGLAEGMSAFLDEAGQLVGESNRSGSHIFLLLVWPEIKTMLAAEPKKTMPDLHEWLLPFMRVGVMPYLDIDQLRDLCAPPPSGIGLSLRPLKKTPSSASA